MTPPPATPNPGPASAPAPHPASAIAVSDLAVGYGTRRVVSDLSFEIPAGGITALLGPNGCGKSTLMRTLLGLQPSLGGSVWVEGQPARQLSRAALAKKLAWVPQSHGPVFPFTAYDVILMGRTAHLGPFAAPGQADHTATQEAAQRLGLTNLLGKDYTALSGGQRQLVLIARALAQGAPILLFDEPTASLDYGNQVRVLKELQRLSALGLTILFTTHDPTQALAIADRALILKSPENETTPGCLLAQGKPETVLTPATLYALYQVSVGRTEIEGKAHLYLDEF